MLYLKGVLRPDKEKGGFRELKAVAVKALPDYKMWVKYADAVQGEVALSHFVRKGILSLWNDYDAFKNVCIGKYGELSGEKVSIFIRIQSI